MPLIAALTPRDHEVSHTDEIVEPVRFDTPADLVGITAPTPSALHAYDLAREFRRRGLAGLSNAGLSWDPAEYECSPDRQIRFANVQR